MGQIAFKTSEIQRYFPKSYTPRQMSDTIIRLLEQYQRRRERDQQR
jgi:ParB family chromosome partitioning protein